MSTNKKAFGKISALVLTAAFSVFSYCCAQETVKETASAEKDASYYINRADNAADVDQAIADYTRAIEIEPKNAWCYFARANNYYFKKNYDQAIADYTRAIEIEPRDFSTYCCRGDIYAETGDHDRAIADYNKAMKIAAGNPRGIFYVSQRRAKAYYHKKDYDKAWDDVHKIKESGYDIDQEFLDKLKKDSGKEN